MYDASFAVSLQKGAHNLIYSANTHFSLYHYNTRWRNCVIVSEVRKKLIQQPLYSHQQVNSRKKTSDLVCGWAVQCFTIWIWLWLNIQTAQGGIFCPLTTHTGLTHKNIGNQINTDSSAVNSAGSLAGLLCCVIYSFSPTNLTHIQCCLWLQNLVMMHQMKCVVVTHHSNAIKAFISCSKSITFWKIASQNVIQYKVKMSKFNPIQTSTFVSSLRQTFCWQR